MLQYSPPNSTSMQKYSQSIQAPSREGHCEQHLPVIHLNAEMSDTVAVCVGIKRNK